MKYIASLFIAILVVGLGFCNKTHAQNLPSGSIGTVNQTATNTYQLFSYSWTAPTTGADYVGLAFRQDPGYWSIGSLSLTKQGSTTNLLNNGNLQYGGATSQGIQAPADWGIWYQSSAGAPPAAGYWAAPGQGWYGTSTAGLGVNTSTAGSWIDGAVGSYDGIYQGFSATAGTTYNFSFYSLGTNSYSNPSIMIGVYAGACNGGVFNCTPANSAFTASATPLQTQGTGGAPTPPPATVQFTNLQFGRNQVADTQWNVSACTTTSSCQIYSTSPGNTYETGSRTNIATGQYISFITNTGSDSGTNPWTMVLYNSNGSVAQTLGTGHILVQGTSGNDSYFFFTNNSFNGTLFSTTTNLNGSGVTFTGTLNPTVTQTNTFSSNGTTTPLASAPTVVSTSTRNITTTSVTYGNPTTSSQQVARVVYTTNSAGNQIMQTYYDTVTTTTTPRYTTTTVTPETTTTYSDNSTTVTDGTPTSTTVTDYITSSSTSYASTPTTTQPWICCGGSSAQFNANSTNVNLINNFVNRTTNDSQVYIQQIGDNNNIVVNQQGTKNNYTYISNSGSGNNINVQQTGNSSTTANYSYNNINGSYNNINVTQTSTGGGKGSFVNVANNNNTVNVTQNDSGSHYAEVGLTGGNKTVNVTQSGSASQLASIQLSGTPSSLTLQQSGSTQNFYSIQFNCATAGGCAPINVKQGN